MYSYVFAKFSRDPTDPLEARLNRRDEALVVMSEAVAAYRTGKKDVALSLLAKAQEGLPREGLAEYFGGEIHLQMGDKEKALESFGRSFEWNAYFARCLLNDRVDERLPGLLEKIGEVLERELAEHHADSESAVLLGAVYVRLDRPKEAIRVIRKALSWGEARWELLLTKAAAHHKLSEKVEMEQAFADLKAAKPNLSGVFTSYEPSFFKGVFAHGITDLAKDLLAPQLEEPARSYFTWRLLQERGDADADKHRETFFEVMESGFPPGEFSDLPHTDKPKRVPKGITEFMGMVLERVSGSEGGFQKCDKSRRSKRARPSGRMTIRVQLDREGKVAQLALEENTTRDDWLAYCVVRKLIPMRFPNPLRAYESFKLPIMFGPEVDGLDEKKKDKDG
jgi:tetratricopeptide (TPR) repeat protein